MTPIFAQLVDEDERRVGLRDRRGQLPQRLRHEPRLRPTCRPSRPRAPPWGRARHGVDDDDVDAVRADEDLRDLERLLAAVGLGEEERVQVDPELLRVLGVERVLRVDERRLPADLLHVGDDGEAEGRLARALGAEHLHDAALGDALAAEREVERQRAGVTSATSRRVSAPSRMIEPLPNCFLDLREGDLEGFVALVGGLAGDHQAHRALLKNVDSLSRRLNGQHGTRITHYA
jgi:hypothetical protein